jgi:hypothetical protein
MLRFFPTINKSVIERRDYQQPFSPAAWRRTTAVRLFLPSYRRAGRMTRYTILERLDPCAKPSFTAVPHSTGAWTPHFLRCEGARHDQQLTSNKARQHPLAKPRGVPYFLGYDKAKLVQPDPFYLGLVREGSIALAFERPELAPPVPPGARP